MATNSISRQIAAIVCTILASTACIVGAVGPAAVNGSAAPVSVQTLA